MKKTISNWRGGVGPDMFGTSWRTCEAERWGHSKRPKILGSAVGECSRCMRPISKPVRASEKSNGRPGLRAEGDGVSFLEFHIPGAFTTVRN